MPHHMLELGARAADDILREAFGIEIVAKALDPLDPDDFLKISAALGDKLNSVTEEMQGPAITNALKTLDVDWENMNAASVSRVVREANKQMLFPNPKLAPRLQSEFRVAANGVMTDAKKSAVGKFKLQIPTSFNKEDRRVAEFVMRNQGNFITDTLGRKVNAHSEKVRRIVSDGVAQGLGRQEIGRELFESFKGLRNNKFYFETVAGSFINRARTAASLSAFQAAGVTQYEWDAVLDEVTTETCRFLHGKRFPVDEGLKRIEQVAQQPEQIKELQPWVRDGVDEDGNPTIVSGTGDDRQVIATVTTPAIGSVDQVGTYSQKVSDKELIDQGMSMPPIHGLCRSTVIAVQASIAAPQQLPQAPPPPAATKRPRKPRVRRVPRVPRVPKTRFEDLPRADVVGLNTSNPAGFEAARDAQIAAMTEPQQEAVRRFAFGYDTTIRQMQRGIPLDEIRANVKKFSDFKKHGGSVDKHIKNAQDAARDLTKMFAKAKRGKPARVYRGMRDLSRSQIDEILVSKEMVFDAVTSTSRSPTTARTFAQMDAKEDTISVVMSFDQKKGVGIDGPTKLSKFDESEVLMPQGSRFRVKSFEQVPGRVSTLTGDKIPPQLWVHMEEIE